VLAPALLRKDAAGTASKEGAAKELAQRVFSPPIVGSLLGLAVGSFAPLMKLLTAGGALNPLYEAMRTLG
jgi:hypothetical protein